MARAPPQIEMVVFAESGMPHVFDAGSHVHEPPGVLS
jgi:hypothetical protein